MKIICDWENCDQIGSYRAPLEKDNSKKYKFFDNKKYHLRLEIESVYLKSLEKVKAQREIMTILSEELKDKIHALEIKIK